MLSSRIIGASSVWSDLGSASAGSEPPEEHWQVSKRWRCSGRGRFERSADAISEDRRSSLPLFSIPPHKGDRIQFIPGLPSSAIVFATEPADLDAMIGAIVDELAPNLVARKSIGRGRAASAHSGRQPRALPLGGQP